ncbi:MBL fold metallo-hydrolase [Candidatus Binatia bacterium]|nr:MBL fold metallo-hydrolase [Candidatus Binatia bacterium]
MDLGHTTVIIGERGGRYPFGNSVLVSGTERRVLIDPSLSIVARRGELPPIDFVLNSHCHEDHLAGNHLFPEVPWYVHERDRPGFVSIEGMMEIYGFEDAMRAAFEHTVVQEFHYVARPDASGFDRDAVFDLGGGVRVRALHTPGHTRGHCCFFVEPDEVLYLGDIDLSSFGPYYGDAWSSLEDFERSIALIRDVDARWYATFHHVGVVDGRAAFLTRLDKFAAVIRSREERLLAFLRVPRSLEDIVAHRFVYRPQDAVPWADACERRSMGQHLERLVREGRVREIEAGRFLAAVGCE